MSAKQYGDAWVYSAMPCRTGFVQPFSEAVRLDACCDFTPDYAAFFDQRGALDAPDMIPRGGVCAQDFTPPSAGRVLVGHVHRDGWFA